MTERLDVVFDDPNGVPLTYDFFTPGGEVPLPLVVFIHGGGWISGDKTHFADEAKELAARGFACACISYRLAPLHAFPCAVIDVQNFVRFARKNAQELGIDRERIAAVGSSAGGHLASMLGLVDVPMDRDERPDLDGESPKVQFVVNLSGLTDLTEPRERHFPIAWSFIEQFMGCPYEENEEIWRRASPLYHVSPTDAEFMIVHGDNDDVVPILQSIELDAALKSVGVNSDLRVYEGEAHGFSDEAWISLRVEILEFLQSRLLNRAGV